MSEFVHDGGVWDHQPGSSESSLFQPDSGLHGPGGLGTEWDAAQPGYVPAADAGPAEIGDPGEYQQDWFYQQHNGYCVPSSVTQVIEAQSGLHLDGYHLVEQEAARLGLPQTDLTLPQAQELLHGFDIPSHIVYGDNPQTAIGELAQYLQQGRNVVLAVNASPIWYGTDDSPDNPHGQADHALVVSAIDPQSGVVTLSDPGTPDGNEEQVPLSTFLDAWSASDYGMLVTDDPAGGADQHAAGTAVEHVGDSASRTVTHGTEAGFVVLPIALGAGWAYNAVRKQTGRTR